MFSTPNAFDQRLPDCQRTGKIPRQVLPPSKSANDFLFEELDEETLSFLEDTRNEIIHRSSEQQGKKRRIYSSIHLDPKKSGRRFRANDRERRRMESLNGALDALKGCIPLPKSKKRMTKLHVLRQACSYIRSLTELLQAAAVELGDEVNTSSQTINRSVINGLTVAQRLQLFSLSGKSFNAITCNRE